MLRAHERDRARVLPHPLVLAHILPLLGTKGILALEQGSRHKGNGEREDHLAAARQASCWPSLLRADGADCLAALQRTDVAAETEKNGNEPGCCRANFEHRNSSDLRLIGAARDRDELLLRLLPC